MINVGVIGTGYMALTHLRAYQKLEGIRVTALCNPSGRNLDGDFTEVARNAGETLPVRFDMTEVKAVGDVETLLKDPDLQVIDICTPTSTHVELSIAALAAGKHVLLEKPIARTSADAQKIVAAAKEAEQRGVYLMPALCIRFWPEYQWLKQTITAGTYGKVLDARFRRVSSAPGWGKQHFLKGTDSGGALLDLHIHDTDFIAYCFGQPHSVVSSGYTRVSGAIDHVVTLYQYPDGPTVSAEGSWGMAPGYPFQMSYVVNFEGATVDYDVNRGAHALRLYVPGVAPVSLQLEGGDGYVGEIKHFMACIQAGHPPTVVTAEDALNSTLLCEAEDASVRSGKPQILS